MSVVIEPHVAVQGTGEAEPASDVLPRLALWLADVSAEATLAPLQPLERPDELANSEPVRE